MYLSTRLKIPIYEETDTPVDVPAAWVARTALLDKLVPIDEGPLSSRPVSSAGTPGVQGRQFVVTDQVDSPRLDVDYGTGWFTAGPALKDAAPSVASLRTLGTGAQQAAAGNDSRLIGGQAASGDISGTLGGALTVDKWGGQTKGAVVAGSPPQAHGSSHAPGGSDAIAGFLEDANNLSDLANRVTALHNLGIARGMASMNWTAPRTALTIPHGLGATPVAWHGQPKNFEGIVRENGAPDNTNIYLLVDIISVPTGNQGVTTFGSTLNPATLYWIAML